jgi:two-component system OmpR family sensor kinase
MAGQETLSSHSAKRLGPWSSLKHLSDRTPLRTKLITAVLALVIMALAAISVASVYMLRSYVTTQNDNTLKSDFSNISLRGLSAGEAGPTRQSGLILGVQVPGKQLSWVPSSQIMGGDGFTGPLPSLPESTNWTSPTTPVLLTVPSQNGPDSWRVMAIALSNFPTVSQNGTSGVTTVNVVLAIDIGNLDALTTRLALFDLVVGGAIVIVLAAVAIGVVRTNLRPLDDIEMTAGQIAAGHLDHRVPEGDPRTEIGSLGRSLNAMLTQIERAFHAQGQAEKAAHQSEERMRRFIADAAHELRTPLTTIRGFAAHYRQRGGASRLRTGATVPTPSFRTDSASSEVAVHSPDGESSSSMEGLSPEELDRLMSRVESEATRMGVLVEDLLTLARLDQQRPLNLAPVDFLTLAADAVQDARVVSPRRPIDLIVEPGTAFLVDGDEARLRQVLANLVNNAITHTPAGTPIRVKIGRGTLETHNANGTGGPTGTPGTAAPSAWGGSVDAAETAEPSGVGQRVVPAVVLDVEDDGPGMTADQAQRVFERFYRADAARNRASGGTGLGLAIVAGLVSAHGGTVSVRTAPGVGADFQVKLPLSPDALVADDVDDDLPV